MKVVLDSYYLTCNCSTRFLYINIANLLISEFFIMMYFLFSPKAGTLGKVEHQRVVELREINQGVDILKGLEHYAKGLKALLGTEGAGFYIDYFTASLI